MIPCILQALNYHLSQYPELSRNLKKKAAREQPSPFGLQHPSPTSMLQIYFIYTLSHLAHLNENWKKITKFMDPKILDVISLLLIELIEM